ncbi:MAG: glycoside hydrolase family 127 protein [Kiritimatiellae bacterium]|nr:glycoside hydrolase family 127 protein [Kiritimatiellia bacterium]
MTIRLFATLALFFSLQTSYAAQRGAALKDVRLGGGPALKMQAFFRERMLSDFAQKEIFGEARRAFETRDDDIKGHGGVWRGEFWGKLMLGTARVAEHLQDHALLAFVREECHRLMALQDADGYLGSYADKELVAITDLEATRKIYGWYPCWNLWNRKYCIWGMFAAYKATGDRAILDSVVRQMDQWIAMMHRKGIRLYDSGTHQMYGMPSMSILKPLLLLYRETGKEAYLAYAKEMIPDWDRADGACPNFFRNATNGKMLADWYPEAQTWAKCYEMMSCLDGLVEYYRVTGEKRVLETVMAIRDNLAVSEANPFGGVGFGDKFLHAAQRPNALSEVCDAIHWIRLNLDLYLETGANRCLDAIETAYFNNFLAGVFRRGDYGAFFVRGVCRHENQYQCGFAYNHCCVNNVPRTFMDMCEGAITVDEAGVFHVNFYQDATVTLNGVKFAISGDYPKGNVVRVEASKPVKPVFRKPAWCPKMTVVEEVEGCAWKLVFDMNPRIVDRVMADEKASNDPSSAEFWMRRRFMDGKPQANADVGARYRLTPAAQVMYGPLVLAKAKRVGDTEAEIFAPTSVNGKGYAVKVTPRASDRVWCAFDVELAKPGAPTIQVKACDFQSAGDEPLSRGAEAFSIWF